MSGSATASSESSSSDTDDETVLDIPDKEFLKTLSCLKTEDPRIYDSNVKFFTEPAIVLNKSQNPSSDGKTSSEKNTGKAVSYTNQPVKNTKFSLKDVDNDSSSEDEMSAFKKEGGEQIQVQNEIENEYIQFLKGKKPYIEDKDTETALKPLYDFWNNEELDENEKFLRDYILNKKYLAPNTESNAEENLSEDEKELEEQADYETRYNFRFENEENLKIKRFPRTIEGSLRRKDDARSKKRAETAKRKKEEKLKKKEDIKRKQKEKLSEIEGRIQKLKELTGNVELGFKDDEILEDFDPEKHDKKMNELFNDDYYNEQDEEYPVFEDDEGVSYWNDGEINMDCDADPSEIKKNKLTRTQKKKLRKKKTYKDVMDIVKPSFDPKVHSNFKNYIDDYYSLDCEDFIDDIPCKFKYREVVPNDYGLSIEEILMADDNDLNRWASIKKITKRRPEHVEKNEVKIYKKKACDDHLKRKMLPSLFSDPEENKEIDTKNDQSLTNENAAGKNYKEIEVERSEDEKMEEQSIIHKKKKKKRKRKHSEIINDTVTEDLNSQNNKSQKNDIMRSALDKEVLNAENTIDSTEIFNTTNNSRKKKRRKKKTHPNDGKEKTLNNEKVKEDTEKTELFKKKKKFRQQEDKKFKNKRKNKLGFKNKKESVVNLSDSRLQAYGIKPKQFRSKLLYSEKNIS